MIYNLVGLRIFDSMEYKVEYNDGYKTIIGIVEGSDFLIKDFRSSYRGGVFFIEF